MKISNPVGKLGEDAAAKYLFEKGYKILERNYRPKYAEIDIIALDPFESTMVFFEVKSRTSNSFGTPIEAINYFKLKNLFKAAQFYAITHPRLPQALRIDAVSIEVKNNIVTNIEHMENISG